jgi:hypothetical protein
MRPESRLTIADAVQHGTGRLLDCCSYGLLPSHRLPRDTVHQNPTHLLTLRNACLSPRHHALVHAHVTVAVGAQGGATATLQSP